MNIKSEGDLLKEACKKKLLSRWPDSSFINTKMNGIRSIDFVIELADGGVGFVEKKSHKAPAKNSRKSMEWRLSDIEPELYQAILRAIKLNQPVFYVTYRTSQIYDKKVKKNVIGFKVSLARTAVKLTWNDIFPDDPVPVGAQWTLVGQSVKKQGQYLVVVHTLKDGRSKQVNEYKIEIEKISKAIYDSTLTFKTFPFNIPHSHKVTEKNSVTYDRSIDDWEQHVDQKGLLEDSKVQSKRCSNCRISFFDTSSQQFCYSCFTAEQSIARDKAIKLCKQAEKLASRSDWKQTANSIKQLQVDWRQLKSIPRDDSEKLWKRFQTATQSFFDRQSAYFDKLDEQRNKNRRKAEAMIEEVRRWSGSDDWKRAGEEIKNIQKQWKNVNPLPREDADKLWRNFQDECQKFFDRRAAHYNKTNQASRK